MLIVLTVLIAYLIVLIILHMGWARTANDDTPLGESNVNISVIIPFRNEAQNIARLLQCLKEQTYQHFEVILVDDHSQDRSLDVIERFTSDRLKVLENAGTGKKRAITNGVAAAEGEIIVTTDADCTPQKEWLEVLSRYFRESDVNMVFGGVRIESDGSFFSSLQAVEFSSLIGSGAAMAAFRHPIMCNGANLAYRKKVFEEVGGYEGNFGVASGDDEFLMRKIQTRFSGTIRFIGDVKAVVDTRPSSSLSNFISQRLRWAAKWKHNSSLLAKGTAVFMFLVQLCWIAGITMLAMNGSAFLFSLVLTKVILEWIFLRSVSRRLSAQWSSTAFVVWQLLYPVYAIGIAVASNWSSYSWKGRQYNR